MLPHEDFSYNRVVSSTTSHSPFEVVYGFNPTTLNLLPILNLDSKLCNDGLNRANMIKELHAQIKEQIEKKNKAYVRHANKGRK